MSSENKPSPYHAKSGSETADTLAEVLEHAAAKDVAAQKREGPKKQPKWMLPLGINLGVFAVYLLIAPPAWVVVDPIEGPPPAEQVTSLRLSMFFQIGAIDKFHMDNGRLPATLEEAGSVTPGAQYIRLSDDLYQLVGRVGDQTLTYNSTESSHDFVGDALNRLGGG